MAYPRAPSLGVAPAAPVPVRWRWIPAGDPGTAATLAVMRAEARRGQVHPVVLAVARRIVQTVNARDGEAVWAALRFWLLNRFQFVPDPADVETVRTPLEQLRQIADIGSVGGDCDDAATLAATLAKALGARVRFVVLGFFRPSDPYRHVYAEMQTRAGWRDFDITRGAGPHPPPVRASVMEV